MKRLWAFLAAEIDGDVLALVLALVLIGIGFWHAWRPGAFLVPGLVLLWLALPTRRAFIDRESSPGRKR